jgi:hypothetical protein
VSIYYLAYALLGEGWRSASAVRAAAIWGATAAVAGPVVGLAGGVWRHGPPAWRPLGPGVPAGILVVEGLTYGIGLGDPVAAVLLLEVLVGALLPLLLVRGRARIVSAAASGAVALVGFLGLTVVLPAVRRAVDSF